MQRVVAVIGTAGRDKQFPLELAHWEYMCRVVRFFVRPTDHLVSGGAAWADHAAVWAFGEGLVAGLTLHLPSPFDQAFVGAKGTSGGVANYYHKQFGRVIRRDTLRDIRQVLDQGARHTTQPEGKGFAAMFARNGLVAEQCTHVLAFTFGQGDEPADGGTKATWDMAGPQRKRKHISLLDIPKL